MINYYFLFLTQNILIVLQHTLYNVTHTLLQAGFKHLEMRGNLVEARRAGQGRHGSIRLTHQQSGETALGRTTCNLFILYI